MHIFFYALIPKYKKQAKNLMFYLSCYVKIKVKGGFTYEKIFKYYTCNADACIAV